MIFRPLWTKFIFSTRGILIFEIHSSLWWGQRPPRRRFKYPPNALKTDLKQIFMVPVWQIGPSIRSSTVPTWFYQFLQGTDCVLQTRCISKSKWILYESDSIMEQYRFLTLNLTLKLGRLCLGQNNGQSSRFINHNVL